MPEKKKLTATFVAVQKDPNVTRDHWSVVLCTNWSRLEPPKRSLGGWGPGTPSQGSNTESLRDFVDYATARRIADAAAADRGLEVKVIDVSGWEIEPPR